MKYIVRIHDAKVNIHKNQFPNITIFSIKYINLNLLT